MVITWKENQSKVEAWKFQTDKDALLLGHLELGMVGRHKHWVWSQQDFIIMSPGCLDEVRDKMKELFKRRK